MIRPFLTSSAFVLAIALTACDKKPAAAPAPEKSTPKVEVKPATAEVKPTAAPTKPEAEMPFPDAVDIGDFGSAEPVERQDLPTRGIITFGPSEYEHSNQAHWETYLWSKFKAKRPGKYQVRLTYTLRRASLGMQFRIGDLVSKKPLKSSVTPRRMYLGTVHIQNAGDFPFSMITPPAEDGSFKLIEVALIPTSEGEAITQAADGSVTLLAKDATTWSEVMRYEPKPEKNCLGFWTEVDDFAEWEFKATKPGKYKVSVSYGCGGGNHGSEVELKQGAQSFKWATQDTGGFQKWQDVSLGEIEITAAGTQRLVIDPVNKVKSAVLDVQKVVLTPAG